MMRKTNVKCKTVISVFVSMFVLLCFTGCSSDSKVDMTDTLPGEWFVWHWYYVEGDSGFYDNAVFYTFSDDGKLTIQEDVEGAQAEEATYVWDNEYTIIVSYSNGTSETFEITPTTYDGHDQLKYTNVDTGLILSMEPMSDWSDD